ncbi:hypothetical protein CD351_12745 [Erythrobacter sp. KY5]|nr:hypothetical protein CD351_12745 [Erythrobacter sp. KY5]
MTACGSETEGSFATDDGETGEYVIDNEDGESTMTITTSDGEVNVRSGSSVAVDLPDGFSLISGAQVVSNTVFDQGGTKGSLISFRSSMSPDEVASFYRAQAEDAGVEIQIETTMNGGKMLGGENEATGLTFSVTAYPDDDGMTLGQLTVGEDPG